MKREIIFEVCAEDLDACEAAREGGANRIELCSALSEGGLTPSHALTKAAVKQSGLPVYTMLRPRAGNFLYSDAEFALMQEDLEHNRSLGASGFVAGVLRADGTIDTDRMQHLVNQAAPLEVTFHRAFDSAINLEHALEDVIATGCRRLLTSGGAPDVRAGAQSIRSFEQQANGRITIAVGGGLRLENASEVARITTATQFHGTVRRATPTRLVTKPEDVQAMIAALRNGADSENIRRDQIK